MWGLNNIANFATEALNNAKKGIGELKKDPPTIDGKRRSSNETEEILLKKQLARYMAENERLNERINELKKEIEEKGQGGDVVNFRIVIGSDDAEENQKILEEKEGLEKDILRLNEELDKILNVSRENTENYKQEIAIQADENKKLLDKNKKLEEQMQGLVEVLQKSKENELDATELSVKIKSVEENSKKVMKEKEDLFKMLAKKEERIKQLDEGHKKLEEAYKKLEENSKGFDEIKNDNTALLQKIKILHDSKEQSDKMLMDLQNKLKIIAKDLASKEDNIKNLNKRLKSLGSTINEKENAIKLLEEKKFSMLNQINDISSNYDCYKQTSEKNLADVKENADLQIKDLRSQLSLAQSKAKELENVKAQYLKIQQAADKLNEVVKSQEIQSRINLTKIDKLLSQTEEKQAVINKYEDKIKVLEEKNVKLEAELSVIHKEFQVEREGLLYKAKEAELVKSEAEILLKRIENQIQTSDNMIDKRMITTFLVNYLSEKNNQKVKMQMLRALAEILNLTQDERTKVGLVHEQGFFSHIAGFMSRG